MTNTDNIKSDLYQILDSTKEVYAAIIESIKSTYSLGKEVAHFGYSAGCLTYEAGKFLYSSGKFVYDVTAVVAPYVYKGAKYAGKGALIAAETGFDLGCLAVDYTEAVANYLSGLIERDGYVVYLSSNGEVQISSSKNDLIEYQKSDDGKFYADASDEVHEGVLIGKEDLNDFIEPEEVEQENKKPNGFLSSLSSWASGYAKYLIS
jgi:hypothetical protein